MLLFYHNKSREQIDSNIGALKASTEEIKKNWML
jgi:hypothetical protein